ncbi:CRISPR-associated helicase Cas3' [Tichowtungia aerotolerans]|uniref:CRISPR-associated helicase Cas3 n=1 Tax=Tichowtungia aerotolerans TaxID=2697043 RepID=A0A6P1M6N9_9BACT|nr:CRISPR-associated helicase Cas3' [Tichowtungia aerotolerans]QHI69682.1 CRISPR-associated helicase Cas3' [Tichowtungia aerotolerans]
MPPHTSPVFYAHSNGLDPAHWQPLETHLKNVAEKAADFAQPFGGEEWGRLIGINHDLGKGTLAWQAWLRQVNGISDEFSGHYAGHPAHADAGAQWLFSQSKQAGQLLAYCVAGHHGGLPNWNEGSVRAGLKVRLNQSMPNMKLAKVSSIPAELPFVLDPERLGFQLQFFARMLFSCLVDADYLDTEMFIDGEKARWRSGYPKLDELSKCFWMRFNALREKVDIASPVNRQRERVLRDCLSAAGNEPGLFSLTVPTGGGKTLASLAFALKHAKKYEKRRIIYVIPFTSIIEQNAAVFRDMLSKDAVLEHHCNFIPDDSDWKTRLASENWDAPVVITTNVQFFNSFYANKPSKCRKLHNVSDSVVIFDEVQAVPVEKLKPCLEIIKELSSGYGVSSVLCTATQPAVEYSDQFQSGLQNVREIVGDVAELFSSLKRTEESFVGVLEVGELAGRLSNENQVLCIVNTRKQALDVFKALPESEGSIHLSALMHPDHRTKTLAEVRQRLDDGLPCRVVSTQLIEAGVDVDFPCVYRAVSGIDSIAQAAGRCNRNGKYQTPRPVCVFEFPEDASCAFFRQAAQSAAKLFDRYSGRLTVPECVREYFSDYFWKNEQRMDDGETLQRCLRAQTLEISFRDIAEFQMIKTATIPIIVALEDEALELVHALDFAEHSGGILRRLQKYTVQVYSYQFDEICDWLEEPVPGVFVLKSEELYSHETGLQCNPPQGQAFFG